MTETYAPSAQTMREQVGEAVRVECARRRISATELARRAGLTQKRMSSRMTGGVAWDIDDLDAIARALGVPVADLIPR